MSHAAQGSPRSGGREASCAIPRGANSCSISTRRAGGCSRAKGKIGRVRSHVEIVREPAANVGRGLEQSPPGGAKAQRLDAEWSGPLALASPLPGFAELSLDHDLRRGPAGSALELIAHAWRRSRDRSWHAVRPARSRPPAARHPISRGSSCAAAPRRGTARPAARPRGARRRGRKCRSARRISGR